jgi:hypothetical protein
MLLSRVGELRGECLDPVEDGPRIYLHAPLGQPFGDFAVTQPIAKIPTHRQRDDFLWEAVPAEGRPSAFRPAAPTGGAAPDLPPGTIPACLDQPIARTPTAPYDRNLRPESLIRAYLISAQPNETAQTLRLNHIYA